MGISVLRALRKYADVQGLKVDENMFRPATALVEFNYEIVGLGGELARVNSGMLNADVDHLDDIAKHVGTTAETIYNTARGHHILVPEEFAIAVSIAASQVLKLSDPMRVRPRPANETLLRPLGAASVEGGKPAHGCEQTTRIRLDVLAWLKRSAADKARKLRFATRSSRIHAGRVQQIVHAVAPSCRSAPQAPKIKKGTLPLRRRHVRTSRPDRYGS